MAERLKYCTQKWRGFGFESVVWLIQVKVLVIVFLNFYDVMFAHFFFVLTFPRLRAFSDMSFFPSKGFRFEIYMVFITFVWPASGKC